MEEIEETKWDKEKQHLKNIREAIKSLKGSLKLLEESDMGLDKDELKKELETLEARERLMVSEIKRSSN